MHVHILGVCGTFMGGVAAIAKAAGHRVSGSDEDVYPPMSTQLRKLGIQLHEGYDVIPSRDGVDCVVVGNVLSRGNAAVEALLDSGLPYYSGPEWLFNNFLQDKWVLAVAGTHGKTTASSMLAWILDYAGLSPGFLIGGMPHNFGVSARLGESEYFVIEADEYDTAFFDKRAKFVHYRPRTLAVTNIEYDHADIYADLDAILWQFHQLFRTVPNNGLISVNGRDENISNLLNKGIWTPVETFSSEEGVNWSARYDHIGAKSRFSVFKDGENVGQADWNLLGVHNLENALAALSSAIHVGVTVDVALEALSKFKGVKRRLEKRGIFKGITLYDDFAHHPTAIRATIRALRCWESNCRIVIVLELRSNTMRMGLHRDSLKKTLSEADLIYMLGSDDLAWNPESTLASLGEKFSVTWSVNEMLGVLLEELKSGDHVVMMSNGGFQGLPRLLQQSLKSQDSESVRV